MNDQRTNNLIKNSFILSFGTLIPKILAILVLPILTTYLTTAEYGNYDLVLSATSLIVPVVMLQIQQASFRYLLTATNKAEKEVYIVTSLVFVIVISLSSAPISFGIGILIGLSNEISVLMCILVASESVYLLLGQVMRGIGKSINYSLGIIIYALVNSALLVVFVLVLHLGLLGVILSITFAYLISALAMFVVVLKDYRIKIQSIQSRTLKKLLAFSMPIVPSSISLWIVNLSDRVIIVFFLGAAANGIYSVANKVPVLYTTAYNIFNLSWTETAAQVADADKNPEIYYSELFEKLFYFLVGVMLLIIAVSPLFYKVFVNVQYYESYYQTAILYFGVFFNSLVMFYAGIYIALKKTKQVGYSSAVGAIINVIINLTLVNRFGLYAASISTMVSYLLIAVYRAIDINRFISIKYNLKQITVGISVLIFSSAIYYTRNIIAYALCFAIALIYNFCTNRYMIEWVIAKLNRKK